MLNTMRFAFIISIRFAISKLNLEYLTMAYGYQGSIFFFAAMAILTLAELLITAEVVGKEKDD